MEQTANEKAMELAKQVDFEQRSQAFGEELDALIQKHKVGIIVQLAAEGFATSGNKIVFNKLEPYIQRVDIKRIEEEQAAQKTNEKPAKEKKGKK